MAEQPPHDQQTQLPDALRLGSIRSTLIRQEDTIIFALIERSQFKRNEPVYTTGEPQFAALTGADCCFLDVMLLETERLHARVRRYTAPDEYAFFPDRLPPPALPLLDFPSLLHPCAVNLNARIMDIYVNKVRVAVCEAGDDAQYGSSVVADVNVLQAISKRVHYGMFVAEAKFRAHEAQYRALIEAGDEAGIMALLTDAAVEARVLQRVRRKAETFGQDIEAAEAPASASRKLDPEAIVNLYLEHIIPLTKEAEVKYLLQRLGNTRIAYHGSADGCCAAIAAAHAAVAGVAGAPEAAPALLQCRGPTELFECVLSNRAFVGVAVLEEDVGGLQRETLRLLRSTPLKVVGERSRSYTHRLVSKGALHAVRTVLGSADALRVCGAWLHQRLGAAWEEVQTETHTLSAAAAASAADDGTAYLLEAPAVSALTPAETGQTAGFAVSIEVDDPQLRKHTRAVVLCKREGFGEPTGRDKTVVLFDLPDKAGRLAEAFSVFTRHGVNLLFVQSSLGGPACFYAELAGHVADGSLAAAIDELRPLSAFVKVVGSYSTAGGGN